MITKHLTLARAFTAARATANAIQPVMMSLHTSRPPGDRCTCRHEESVINELDYPGYKRMPVMLVPDPCRDKFDLKTFRPTAAVCFPAYRGKYPVVVTHLTLWDAVARRRFLLQLTNACILQPGDVMTFLPNSLTVWNVQEWEPV